MKFGKSVKKAYLINATSISLETLEKSKNETLYFENKGQLIRSDGGFSNRPYKEL